MRQELDLSYSEMLQFEAFGDRFNYLNLWQKGYVTPRFMSNGFYDNPVWKQTRLDIIRRDFGSNLGVMGCDIPGLIIVHHINPLTPDDIEENNVFKLYNPENLITVSLPTHNAIHYKPRVEGFVERRPGDTKLW